MYQNLAIHGYRYLYICIYRYRCIGFIGFVELRGFYGVGKVSSSGLRVWIWIGTSCGTLARLCREHGPLPFHTPGSGRDTTSFLRGDY